MLENNKRAVRTLLSVGASPKFGGGTFGSCLHIAVTKMNVEFVVKFL